MDENRILIVSEEREEVVEEHPKSGIGTIALVQCWGTDSTGRKWVYLRQREIDANGSVRYSDRFSFART